MIPSLTSENANTALLVGDGDVRAGNEAGAAAESVALDPRDDGRGAAVDRLEHAAERVRVGHVGVEVERDRRPHPLDVGAGAEARPFAGEQHGPGLAHVDERLGELGDQRRVEGVACLRPRQRDPQQVAVAIDPERCHRQRSLQNPRIPLRLSAGAPNTGGLPSARHF